MHVLDNGKRVNVFDDERDKSYVHDIILANEFSRRLGGHVPSSQRHVRGQPFDKWSLC